MIQLISQEEFFFSCETNFHYLVEEFGFVKEETTALISIWGVTLRNPTTEIRIAYERREQDVYVRIVPTSAVSGRDYNYNFWNYSFYLQNVLVIEGISELLCPRVRMRSLTREEVLSALSKSADALRRYGSDMLRGDFSRLPQIMALRT